MRESIAGEANEMSASLDEVTDLEIRVAHALMAVYAAPPCSDGTEYPVLDADPDFDDLPIDHTQGTMNDSITQEAVLRLARAAIRCIAESG